MSLEDRYAVHFNIPEIGTDGQKRLKGAKVAIVGLGGLGSNIALGLTSLGIGNITLIDNDEIAIANLSRQMLYTEDDIGFSKCSVAASQLKQRNSEIKYHPIQQRLTNHNKDVLLLGQEIIMDGTDNLASRMAIDFFCQTHNVPMIYGGVKGFSGQVSVFNYNFGKSFGASFRNLNEFYTEENCNDSGVIFSLVSIVANIQVMQAVNIILGRKPVLQGTVLLIDLLNLKFRQFKLS